MYCSLDRLDMIVRGKSGEVFGAQVDHRTAAEIEATPELSVLFALARVLNARQHLRDSGEATAGVRYMLDEAAPPVLREALAAAGAALDEGDVVAALAPAADAVEVGALVDAAFRGLAARAGARIGSRDPGLALRMLEDQTRIQRVVRADDELAYWTRVLELAAFVGELMRARFGGRWVETTQAVVPFGFQLDSPLTGVAEMFPTNRAQRFVDEGGESLWKLVAAAEETLRHPPDARTDRLMPSLRTRASVELDEVVWRPLVAGDVADDVPIVVCGVDGEVTFGMMRRESLGERTPAEALDVAVANLADEVVEREAVAVDGVRVVIVTGGFYAAEKVLDHAFMAQLQAELGAAALVAAIPARGELFVCADEEYAARGDRFVELVHASHAAGGSKQITLRMLRVVDGVIVGLA